MSDNKEDLSLRDKFAIEILNGIVSCKHYKILYWNDKIGAWETKNLETYCDYAYKIADQMRKSRLKPFD